MLEECIVKLQKDLELKEPLGSAEEGGYALLLDDMKIIISEAEAGFQLMANLGELPSEAQEHFFTKMLRGNLFGQATNKAALGLDENGALILLRAYRPQKCSYREFKEYLEDYINTIDFWKQEIALHKQNPATP